MTCLTYRPIICIALKRDYYANNGSSLYSMILCSFLLLFPLVSYYRDTIGKHHNFLKFIALIAAKRYHISYGVIMI